MEPSKIPTPKEVVEENSVLETLLTLNNLRRFQQVSNAAKWMTNHYLQFHCKRAPEIEINPETGKTFAAFMAKGIVSTNLHINNPHGYRFYQDGDETEKAAMRLFMDMHGKHIKHLRVTQLTMWAEGPELQFLNSLVNIESLEVDRLGWGESVNTPEKQNERANTVMLESNWRFFKDAFPASFKNLESIRIGENKENEAINKLKITGEIFLHCQKLKRASLPFTWTAELPPPDPDVDLRGSLMGDFSFLGIYIEPRPNDVYSEKGRLELYDFINYHDDLGGWDEGKTSALICLYWCASKEFMALLGKAKKTGLKFANVSPYWFYARYAKNRNYSGKELGIPVVSLRGLNPMMMTMDMPNLEKITVPKTSCCVGVVGGEEKPDWPALKSLDVTVDDCVGYGWDLREPPFTICQAMSIQGLWMLLFKDAVRINLTELELKFEENGRWKQNVDASIPRIDDIVSSCPNLKKIMLGNWPGTNKQLWKLWQGLPGLEEVTLENCKEVGNVSFLGEEKERPVFFKLKNLKKLTLKGLDKMPGITDLLFSLILAKMNLKELVLTSEKPLEKVTKEGITALLEGPFAGTIEKFPFKDWSMAGVSAEEFKEMGMRFGACNMI